MQKKGEHFTSSLWKVTLALWSASPSEEGMKLRGTLSVAPGFMIIGLWSSLSNEKLLALDMVGTNSSVSVVGFVNETVCCVHLSKWSKGGQTAYRCPKFSLRRKDKPACIKMRKQGVTAPINSVSGVWLLTERPTKLDTTVATHPT